MSKIVYSGFMTCQECGEKILWRSDNEADDRFASVIDKLIYHINDVSCSRERKLKEVLGTKERLAQDHWIRRKTIR